MQRFERRIQSYIDNRSLVDIAFFDEEYDAIILAHSQKFILLADIYEFSFLKNVIIVKEHIKRITYNKLQKFHEHLCKKYANCSDIKNIEWLDLTSYQSIFQTLKDNCNEISISGDEEYVNQFMIGRITEYNDQYLYVNKLGVFGEISKEEYEIPINEITSISFADEYSKILFNYAKQHSNLEIS
jgi:hypothetical protein